MNENNLYGFVLIVITIGMLVGVGVLALNKLGDAAKVNTAISESITIAASSGDTVNDEVVSLQAFYNASQTWVVNTDVNFTEAGAITTTANVSNGTYTLNYTYKADASATTATDNAATEVSNISANWLGLIVTLVVLAIIMSLVIRSFAVGRR